VLKPVVQLEYFKPATTFSTTQLTTGTSFYLATYWNQIYKSMMSSLSYPQNDQQNYQGNASSKPRTFRLSLIPTSVKESELREYLNALECSEGLAAANILAFSLAPFIDWLVATVTFGREPLLFAQCRPGLAVYFTLPVELAESSDDIAVDCDFFGITPLYYPPIPQEPSYE